MSTPDRPLGDGRKQRQEPDAGQAALDALLTWLEERYPGFLGPRRAAQSPGAHQRPGEPAPEGARPKEGPPMDLYAIAAVPGVFRRACGGNQQEDEQETCVEIAPLTGAGDAYALRDSKNPDAGELRFTGSELRAAGIRV